MSDASKIEWTEATWNVLGGCKEVSPGCRNCYAKGMAHRFSKPGAWGEGLTQISKGGVMWSGKVRLRPEMLRTPLSWRRPRKIFVCSTSDLFHPDVPLYYVAAVFGIMAMCPQHTFQVLTKRPERAATFFSRNFHPSMSAMISDTDMEWSKGEKACADLAYARQTLVNMGIVSYDEATKGMTGLQWPLRNVWLGVSAEDQKHYDERAMILRNLPAAVRFVSAEPLLGPISIEGSYQDWVITGGESGHGARLCDGDWIRQMRDRCKEQGVAFFFKQWGRFDESGAALGKGKTGNLLDGKTHMEFPHGY